MKLYHSIALSTVLLFGANNALNAQYANKPQYKNLNTNNLNDSNKNLSESQLTFNSFNQMLQTIGNSWFGKAYANANAVSIDGNLNINLKASDVNAKINQLNYDNQNKVEATKNANTHIHVKGIYFANADFRIEWTGAFGNILSYRVGNKGFLYSKEQNAWTSNVDLPPTNAPTNFSSWFRQCLNEIQDMYTSKSRFQAHTLNGSDTQTLVFDAPTRQYNSNEKEQSIAESMNFWKRGHVEIVVNKATHQPIQMTFQNTHQGVNATMNFSYGHNGKLTNIAINNKSHGAEGPTSLNLTYDQNELLTNISGKTKFGKGNASFNLNLNFMQNYKVSSIISVPPPTAVKRGRAEIEALLVTDLAEKIMGLQRNGLGLRKPSVH